MLCDIFSAFFLDEKMIDVSGHLLETSLHLTHNTCALSVYGTYYTLTTLT